MGHTHEERMGVPCKIQPTALEATQKCYRGFVDVIQDTSLPKLGLT